MIIHNKTHVTTNLSPLNICQDSILISNYMNRVNMWRKKNFPQTNVLFKEISLMIVDYWIPYSQKNKL